MPRTPRKITPKSLENVALHYLGRYATSSENLRRVLMRRVERSARVHGTDPAEGAAWVEALIARFQESRILDDAAYVGMRVATLRRRGDSARAIRAKLRGKGVAAGTVEEGLAGETGESELAAAIALVRRRRLGPCRVETDRRAFFARDMAALARAGFTLDVARRILEAASLD